MNLEIRADAAPLLKHLDELIKEHEAICTGIYARGEVRSREFARHRGTANGLQTARRAVAEWIEEQAS